MAQRTKTNSLPLEGIRVVELADGLGEMCGRMLADFGAEVIKVEPPGGAKSRKLSPLSFILNGNETSCSFAYRNFNKKGIVLDLGNGGDAELKELLASTDILVESFKPGAMEEMGLSAAELQAEFPHLIIASITPFGQTGPYAKYEATEATIFALSGWLGLSGIPEKPPITAPGYLAYDVAGIMGCFASLVALVKRFRTGMGQHLDVSAAESLAQCGTWGLINTSATINAGMPPVRMRSGATPLYALFPTQDGMVRLVILSPTQWHGIWEWLDKPEEFADPSWESAFQRIMNADVLNPYFARLFADQKMEECAKEAQKRRVVVTPMLKPGDIIKNEHFVSRGTFVEEEVVPSENGDGKKDGNPKGKIVNGWMEINSKRIGWRHGAPAVGEHTDEILKDSKKRNPISLKISPDDEPALKDLRVMDFGHGGVGVEGGKLLAEYGADVIKIENRVYPDFIRTVMGSEMSPSFASSSRSKRSLGVRPRDKEGNEILKKLAAVSDIVIENNSTGTMDTLGISYKELKKANPNITMASSQMMGSHGVYKDWIGYGPTISTVGGIDWLWGFDDGDPPPGTAHIHPDHMAGRICAIAGLLGVIARQRGGKGFHAEMAQVENLMCTLGDFFLAESLNEGSIRPQGNDFGGDSSQKDVVWGPFLCKAPKEEWLGEDWCVICVRSENDQQEDQAEWGALVDLMGNPDWAKELAKDRAVRFENQEEILKKVSEWTKGFSSQELMEKCQAAGIPAGAMLFYDQFTTDSHFEARGFALQHEQQGLEGGPVYFEGAGFKASNLPEAYFSQAPKLGEHTYEICRELLGITDEEIEDLIARSILETDDMPETDAG